MNTNKIILVFENGGKSMQIRCLKCEVKNDVASVIELKEISFFQDRLLVIGQCRACNQVLAQLIEIRKTDNKVFVNNFYGKEAEKIIKREKRRAKIKISNEARFHGFVYGLNKEIKNRNGEITKIRQYASDLKTNEKDLIKTIILK